MSVRAALVKRDASLTYRLLRVVNSPIRASRQEVHSVESAIGALWREPIAERRLLASIEFRMWGICNLES